MIIREAAEKDVDRMTELCLYWAKDMGYSVSRDEIRTDLRESIETGVVILCEDDGQVVGVMSGYINWHFWVKENIAHEHWFFVHPEYRGKRIARGMETYFTAWAKSRTCTSVMMSPNKFGSMDPASAADRMTKFGYEVHGYLLRKRL